MNLVWKEQQRVSPLAAAVGDNAQHVIYLAEVESQSDEMVKSALESSIEKSVGFLSKNVKDESRYMLFEWDVACSMLTIVVTDDAKKVDSPIVVKCSFSGLDGALKVAKAKSEAEWERQVNDHAENVNYWLKDYLTTCPGFMNYSLVAAFHCKDRSSCVLL